MHYFIKKIVRLYLSTFINEYMHRTFARKVKIKNNIFIETKTLFRCKLIRQISSLLCPSRL